MTFQWPPANRNWPFAPGGRAGPHRTWLADELAFVHEHYGTWPVADIADHLGRGLAGVRSKVLELGLRCRTVWTAALDEIVALMFPDTPAAAVGELIGATAAAVRQRAAQLGVRKEPGFAAQWARVTTRARSPFTAAIKEVIELLYPDTLTQDIADLVGMPLGRVHGYANKRGWKKLPEFVRETARQRSGPGHPMALHRFPKGNVPANKGVKGWQAGGRAVQTQFKKGQRPQTWKPIGSLRINPDGYLDRKVTDTGYPPRDWQAVHRLVWIQAHGPIPAGHVVRFKPGTRSADVEKITVDVLECISLAEHGRRNSFRTNYPPEVVKLIQTKAHMQRMINKRQRQLAEARP